MIQQFILSTTCGKYLPIIYYRKYGKNYLEGKVCETAEHAENLCKRMAADALHSMLLKYINHREKVFKVSFGGPTVSQRASINALFNLLAGKYSLEKTVEMIFENRYHVRNIMPGQKSKFFIHQSEFVESLITYCFNEIQKKHNDSIGI